MGSVPFLSSVHAWLKSIGSSPARPGEETTLPASAAREHQPESAAGEASSRLAAVMQSSEDAILTLTLDGVILAWNRGAERLYGYSSEEARGNPVSVLFLTDHAHEPVQILDRVKRGERVGALRTIQVTKEGRHVDTSVRFSLIHDENGQVKEVCVVARDLTERKYVEEEMKRLTGDLRALNAVITAVNESPDLDTVLARALEQIVALVGVDGGECHLVDSTGALVFRAHYRLPPSFVTESKRWRFETGEGIPGQVAASRAAVFVPDLLGDSRYKRQNLAREAGYRSLLCVPILGRADLLGTFTLYTRKPHEFTEQVQTLLIIIGRQLAAAVERARLYEAERQRTLELDRSNTLIVAFSRVAARLATAPDRDAVMQSLGTELNRLGVHCVVALLDSNDEALVIHYASPESVSLALAEKLSGVRVNGFRITPEKFSVYAELVEGRRPVFVPLAQSLAMTLLPGLSPAVAERALRLAGVTPETAAAFLPMIVEQRVLGALAMWGSDLREGDVPALSVFTNQVAIALENVRLFNQVQQLAMTDDLTGIYNRRHFFELAERECSLARRYRHPASVIMIDVDRFKQVNDTLGHAAGDRALKAVAEICRQHIRSVDILGRYGGEEFAILLPETNQATAKEVAERLRQSVAARPLQTTQGPVVLTLSVGVATAVDGSAELADLLLQADSALYDAKQAGRNRVAAHTE